MPALLAQTNYSTPYPPIPDPSLPAVTPSMQSLLIGTITIFLAAASLAVACLQFMHQKKASVHNVVQYDGNDPSREDSEDLSGSAVPSYDVDESIELEEIQVLEKGRSTVSTVVAES